VSPHRHLIDDYGHTTVTRPVDEFNDEFPTVPAVHMTRADLNEAAHLLAGLHDLIGVQAEEVMALLVSLLDRRDGASMAILRWLRGLDGQARS
jgi:hypothetical protein